MNPSSLTDTAAFGLAVVAAARGLWSPCGLSMLSALNPVSESARGHRFGWTATWYVFGAVAGGAVLGAGCALGAFGWAHLAAPSAVTLATLAGAATVAVLSDSPAVRCTLPVHPRQVDERWIGRYRRWVYAAGFGVQIGTGFATYIMTAALYTTALFAVLTADPPTAFAVGLVFGLVRGLEVLATSRVRTPEGLRKLGGRIDQLGSASLRLAAAGNALAGAGAMWLLGGPIPAAATLAALGALSMAPNRGPRRAAGQDRAAPVSGAAVFHAGSRP